MAVGVALLMLHILQIDSRYCAGRQSASAHVATLSQCAEGLQVTVNSLQAEGKKTVPLEVQKDVIHDRRGILSMGRHSDPNSGGSSFSILLDPAPHLDQEYTIFG